MSGTILITGAARRVGRFLARGLAAQGYRIAAHYRGSEEEARSLRRDIIADGGRCEIFKADLAIESEVANLVPAVAERLGPPDILINNASLFEKDSHFQSDRELWDRQMAVNLRAPFVLSRDFERHLPKDRHGLIVHMIDQRVLKPNPLFASYTLSKSALLTLTRTAAQAFAPRIRVNAIGPGPVMASHHQSDATFEAECAALPLGRGPSLQEILDGIRYLIATPSLTGQMLALDGGQHLAWKTADMAFGGGERDGRQ